MRFVSRRPCADLFYALKGYDKNAEPNLDQLDKTRFSPDYVYRETKRCVEAVAGKAKIYSGIGFDIPWNKGTFPVSLKRSIRPL